MLTKLASLTCGNDLIGSSSVFNDDETSQISTQVLTKVRKAAYLAQPSGYSEVPSEDYWIHMQFAFNASKSDVVVSSWWITDSAGTQISLSKLSYQEVQFVSQAMAEETSYHSKLYYHELEASAYGGA